MEHRRVQQLVLNFPTAQQHAAQDLWVGEANRHVVDVLFHQPQPLPTARFLLLGESGSGKTHLAHLWTQRVGGQLISAAELHEPFVELPLAIDDIECVPSEQLLFHLINHHYELRLPLLLTTHRVGDELPFKLPDLTSRLKLFQPLTIGLPDDDTMQAVMQKLCADRHLLMTPDVMQYLLTRLPRSYRAVAKLVAQLDELSLSQHKRLTIPLVKTVLT